MSDLWSDLAAAAENTRKEYAFWEAYDQQHSKHRLRVLLLADHHSDYEAVYEMGKMAPVAYIRRSK